MKTVLVHFENIVYYIQEQITTRWIQLLKDEKENEGTIITFYHHKFESSYHSYQMLLEPSKGKEVKNVGSRKKQKHSFERLYIGSLKHISLKPPNSEMWPYMFKRTLQMWLHSEFWKWNIVLDYPGGLKCNTKDTVRDYGPMGG